MNCDTNTSTLTLSFNIENTGGDTNLQGLTARYYYTSEDAPDEELTCEGAGIDGGCGSLAMGTEPLDLATDERAIVVTLPSHTLTPFSRTGNIDLALTTEAGTHMFSQDDDYSHVQRDGSASPCERMTLHRADGEVLWGVEPGSYLE
jgi:hypothetical protein